MQLDGTVCALTGATGGIGHALAIRLAGEGVRLIVTGRSVASLTELRDELPAGTILAQCAGDLTTTPVQSAFCEAARRNGATVLINLCGSNAFGLFEDQQPEHITQLLTTNLATPIQLTHQLLGHLQNQTSATIVNVGSTFGTIGFPGYAVYSASKFGLRGFSEALARELADTRVAVLHVSPRATRTAMNSAAVSALNAALGNSEDAPETVAAAIVEAMRRGDKRTNIGWPERFFARLNQVLPAVVDKVLARQLPTVKRFAGKRPYESTQEVHVS